MSDVKTLSRLFQRADHNAYLQLIKIVNKETKRVYTEKEILDAHYALFLHCFTFGDLLQGRKSMNHLLYYMSKDIGKFYADTILKNVPFYTFPLGITPLHTLKNKNFQDREIYNPFVFCDPVTGGYVGGARCMKHSFNKGSAVQIYVYDKNGHIIRWFPFDPTNTFEYEKFGKITTMLGFEDVRVINAREQDCFLGFCTTMNTHKEGLIRMSMFKFKVKRDPANFIIGFDVCKKLYPLRGYKDELRTKNWAPFWHNNKLHFIYDYEPLIVLQAEEIDGDFTGKVIKIHESKNNILNKLRGNTRLIEVDDKWISIGHYTFAKLKYYTHRLVEMNKNFEITRVSDVFYFERPADMEFAISMEPFGDDFLIGYGIKDKIARISSINRDTLLAKLKPIEYFCQDPDK